MESENISTDLSDNKADFKPDTKPDNIIEMRKVSTRFGSKIVHTDLDLDIRRGEIFAIVGGSGSGKSTLLREMILLHKPDSGSINIFGTDLATASDEEANLLRQRWGVMFQKGGLFSTLKVIENIGLPLREHTALDDQIIDEIAAWKLSLSGLEPESGSRYPSELSGGMLKRAALARALALDPELLFLDEPTAGLDPAGAAGIDSLVRDLHALYNLTIVMITHDLDLLWQVTDRVAVLGEGRVLAVGSMSELSTMDHPIIRQYFDGARGRAAQQQDGQEQKKQQQVSKTTQTVIEKK
ncbi:ATP-binding cassette domain-containing protein [Undibacterium sp. 5I1]|uniref:ABC transporter ATP-binding protein n=1 Tax=unclassified Undibacterium TaxID=2630295 RepID=UPI002AB40DC1|nr:MULTISPECIES: ATP-binding cassette domain-containing protein [unclassified Undibacterium]MDY7537398.1 ATP-binding cassette domain-containing protein [Undibacterium sp. 5I1]MEB0232268.1 ATP-binding cassette domain-containing protein [Undibacterium sp. 10I3]MEB0259715.1 ATP-binding cassette domain-containing protein [Undibacterium sp. 5I1]